jgi:hypothetical protein
MFRAIRGRRQAQSEPSFSVPGLRPHPTSVNSDEHYAEENGEAAD